MFQPRSRPCLHTLPSIHNTPLFALASAPLLTYPSEPQGEADIKYIDPSYMIRSVPTTSNDRIYCKVLGQGAVHGAFAGFTDVTVGLVNTHYVYLPIPTIIQAARKVGWCPARCSRHMADGRCAVVMFASPRSFAARCVLNFCLLYLRGPLHNEQVNPKGRRWNRLITAIRQPDMA